VIGAHVIYTSLSKYIPDEAFISLFNLEKWTPANLKRAWEQIREDPDEEYDEK